MCGLCSEVPEERQAAVEAERNLAKRLRAFADYLDQRTWAKRSTLHAGGTSRELARGLIRDLVEGWL